MSRGSWDEPNRFLGAPGDSGPGGVRRSSGRTEGCARDAPAILRSRWRCPPSGASCALPRAACSGLGTPPALHASESVAERGSVLRVAVTSGRAKVPNSYAIQSETHPSTHSFREARKRVAALVRSCSPHARKMKRRSFRVFLPRPRRYAPAAPPLTSPFLLFPASACHMASAPSRLTKPSTASAGSGCHPTATNARNARKMNARPTTVAA